MTVSGQGRLRWVLLGAIVLLAAGLRFYRLGTESLWYDETVSAMLASQSLPAMVAHTAGDIHPPGYYLLLHAWSRLAGSSDWGLALLSLFFGVLLVILVYPLGAQVFGTKAGLLASFLVAISPFNVWYSQEVRMYTLGAALGLGVLAALMRLLVNPDARGFAAWGRLALYTVCGALGLWTLYYFAFLLVAVNLMVGGWWLAGRLRRRVGWGWLGRWVLAQGAVLLLYAPWLPTAWRQATAPPVPPWRGFTALGDILVESWSALSLGQSVRPVVVWPVLMLFAVLFGLGLFAKQLRPRLVGRLAGGEGLPWLLAGYVFLPLALIYLASFLTPLYHVRYLFTYSTPFYILVGAGLAWLRGRWKPALWLSVVVLVAFSGFSLYAYHFDPRYASDDHRAAVRFLAERWRPGDAVLINAGYAYPALLTYWDGDPIAWMGRLVGDEAGDMAIAAGQRPVVLETGTVDGDPSLGWGDPSSDFYAMSQAETEKALERLFAASDRVWVYRIYDTVTDPQGFIRRWLEEHGTPFEDQVFSGESQLRVQGFLAGRDPLAGETRECDAGLADGSLQLVGATPLPSTVEVGEALDTALSWKVTKAQEGTTPAGGEGILFAGLFDETGRRWAQADERPLGSLYPAASWPEGAVVRTPLRIEVPPGTPPGRYRLEVGWYRFVDGQPVWLPWTSGERLALGEVEVVAPEDWQAMPLPEVGQPAHVTIGKGVRLLGSNAPSLEGYPGDTLDLDLFWQALDNGPEAGPAVLQLQDDAGQVLAEWSSAPVGGRVPLTQLSTGQTIRDPRQITLPGDLAPGVYNLVIGRQRVDGAWLSVRRDPFPLGTTYPLATLRVLGRPVDLIAPTVQHAEDAQFGAGIRFIGYDESLGQSSVLLTLYWQALASMDTPYKIFLHLVDEGEPSQLYAQADVYPYLPTMAWIPGEYLSDQVTLELPADLPPGRYKVLLGWYDQATGQRLLVYDATGTALGDSLALGPFDLEE